MESLVLTRRHLNEKVILCVKQSKGSFAVDACGWSESANGCKAFGNNNNSVNLGLAVFLIDFTAVMKIKYVIFTCIIDLTDVYT